MTSSVPLATTIHTAKTLSMQNEFYDEFFGERHISLETKADESLTKDGGKRSKFLVGLNSYMKPIPTFDETKNSALGFLKEKIFASSLE